MATRRRNVDSAVHPSPTRLPLPNYPQQHPIPKEFLGKHQSSFLYSMLPNSVSSRLPRIPSIRQSVNMYRGVSKTGEAGWLPHRRSSSSVGASGSVTPPPTYDNAMVMSMRQTAQEVYYAEQAVESRPSSSSSAAPIEGSGIGWKFAAQGKKCLHHIRAYLVLMMILSKVETCLGFH
jgi:hypothetical protein